MCVWERERRGVGIYRIYFRWRCKCRNYYVFIYQIVVNRVHIKSFLTRVKEMRLIAGHINFHIYPHTHNYSMNFTFVPWFLTWSSILFSSITVEKWSRVMGNCVCVYVCLIYQRDGEWVFIEYIFGGGVGVVTIMYSFIR